jgi:hypothetical protein
MTAICGTLLTMTGCGGKTQEVPFDNGDSADVYNIDPTIYGVCGEATSMNSLQLITDTGDTLTLDLSSANDNGQVMGGLQTGDRMAVLPSSDSTGVVRCINQTALLGNWVMPNPLDGSDEVGIIIKEGGIAESIEQPSISFKTWRLSHGMLEIVLVREGGAGDEETNLYEIVKLTPDSLVYKDAENEYEYGRQKPRETYGTDIMLEEASDDDFKI